MAQVVLITGATSGYGLAAAKRFHENGYTVIIVSRSEAKVRDCVAEYGFADGYKTDVSVYSEWQALKEKIADKYGKVDILVNNAGGGVSICDTVDQSEQNIDKAIGLNLSGVIYGSKVFGEMMRTAGHGTIINISSVCARHAWAGWSVYAAAKAGVLHFTKGLYVELRPYGVRATCIIPAAASTGFQTSAGLEAEDQTLTPEDIANAVFYAATQPDGVVIEEMTVWGTSQDVQPL